MQFTTDTASITAHGTNGKNPHCNQGSHSNRAAASQKRHKEIEELDVAIGRMSHAINAASYELMVLIREFDERAGWLKWGFKDGLNWLKWRCDLSTNAARDKLRIAHALKELPLLSESFSKGKLSYTKVRALTRVATAHNEEDLIELALKMSARHVEEHCKQRSNALKASSSTASRAQKGSNYRIWPDQANGTIHFSVELPAEEAELIEKAVEKAAVQLSASTGSCAAMPEESVSWATQQAEALVFLCRSFLDGAASDSGATGSESEASDDAAQSTSTPNTASSSADHYQVVVHIDEAALAGTETGSSQLPLETVRRVCCDGSIVPLIEDADGAPLNVGRKTRIVPTAIRRALWARDKGCGFPGCSHDRFVDAHHIQHWADGGETSIDNLVLLCTNHHKLVHEDGYTIQRDQSGELFFRRPDGKAVPHSGYHLNDQIESDACFDSPEADSVVVDYLKNSREFFEVEDVAGDYKVERLAVA